MRLYCLGLFRRYVRGIGIYYAEGRENVEAERLLGVDITGHADCPLLRWTKDPVKRQERFLLLDEEDKAVKFLELE